MPPSGKMGPGLGGGGGTQRRPECTRDANEVYRLWHHRQQQHCVAQYRRRLLAESNTVPAGRVISGPLRRRPPQREPNLCPLAFSLNPSTLSNALVFFLVSALQTCTIRTFHFIRTAKVPIDQQLPSVRQPPSTHHQPPLLSHQPTAAHFRWREGRGGSPPPPSPAPTHTDNICDEHTSLRSLRPLRLW